MNHELYVMGHIKELSELLDFEYDSPDHNNKKDPLDELMYILLSRRMNRGNQVLKYNKGYIIFAA